MHERLLEIAGVLPPPLIKAACPPLVTKILELGMILDPWWTVDGDIIAANQSEFYFLDLTGLLWTCRSNSSCTCQQAVNKCAPFGEPAGSHLSHFSHQIQKASKACVMLRDVWGSSLFLSCQEFCVQKKEQMEKYMLIAWPLWAL